MVPADQTVAIAAKTTVSREYAMAGWWMPCENVPNDQII
jgi:hypothetical protein